MLQTEGIRPIAVARSPQQRMTTIAIVAGFHVAAIAVFLVALHPPIFQPTHDAPIDFTYIPPKPPVDTAPKPPTVTLANPQDYTEVQTPDIQIQDPDSANKQVAVIEKGDRGTGPILVQEPRPLVGTHTTPEYPQIDARLGHEGMVLLKLSIDETGTVVAAEVQKSSGFESLDNAAVNWVKAHWRYYPATRNGDAFASTAVVTVTFRLTGRQ